MSALIECKALTKVYGNKQVLKNVEFEIQAGQPIALVGPNGAGKSTLFSILSGYVSATAGQAKVLGYPVGCKELVGRIGALPQDALFDPNVTILQQLSFFARLQGYSRSNSLIEAQRCLDLMQLLSIKNEKITALSHGMKKRVAIAQALMGTPELVLLDEPTAGLDPENARNIRQQVADLGDEITFIVSSHNLSELEKMCAQVLHLEQGELKALQAISSMELEGIAAQDKRIDYLTLRLQQKNQAMVEHMKGLSSVVKVDNKQDNEFVIHYDRSRNPILDQQLLQLLASKGIAYRQITRGQSLEDQLFMARSQ